VEQRPIHDLVRVGAVRLAEGRAADVLGAAEVGLERLLAHAERGKALVEALQAVEMDALGRVVEAAHLVEAHALELVVADALRRHHEAEVRRPRDRRARLRQSPQPERGPPYEVLWPGHDHGHAGGQTQKEVIDEAHVVIERRPVEAHIPGREPHRLPHAVERGHDAPVLPDADARQPRRPRRRLHGTDAFGGRLYDGQRIRRRRDAVLGQRQDARSLEPLGTGGDNGDPRAGTSADTDENVNRVRARVLEHRRRDQQRNGAEEQRAHERSGARLVALDREDRDVPGAKARIGQPVAVTGGVLEELTPGSPADSAAGVDERDRAATGVALELRVQATLKRVRRRATHPGVPTTGARRGPAATAYGAATQRASSVRHSATT